LSPAPPHSSISPLSLHDALPIFYNSTDPTKTETGSSPTTLIWDLTNMTFTVNGMTFHNNIPGQGRVAHDTGSITWELLSYDPVRSEEHTSELQSRSDLVCRLLLE